jgi:hypothetical protein
VSDKILFAEKTCRNGAKEPALNVRFPPGSDRLLQCRAVTLWANRDQSAPQQKRHSSITSSAMARRFPAE